MQQPEKDAMKKNNRLSVGIFAIVISACLLITSRILKAQARDYDLARDWSLSGEPLKGMPFGPRLAWIVEAVQFKPEWKSEVFDRAMHFTISNPWLDLYGIDGWWLGSSPVARKPMVGKNVGQGNIPGMVHGVNYDWPVGKVAAFGWPNADQSKGDRTMTAVVWTAPEMMEVGVAGGIWMAGQYLEVADYRTRVTMWIHRASAGSSPPSEIIFQDVALPLWTDGFDSGHPQSFAQILGARATELEKIKLQQGDQIAVSFYWDSKATKPGLSGIDFRVVEVR